MTLKKLLVSPIFALTMLVAVTGTLPTKALAATKNTSDDFLTDTIRQKLAADPVVKGGAIEVEVHEGAVVLKGTVEEEKQKSKAEKITKKVGGVKNVSNQIKLSRP